MPLHVADTSFSDSPKMSFEKTALPAAVERGVGIFGIKVFGNAFLLRTFSAGDCLRYSLSLPNHRDSAGLLHARANRRRCAHRADLQTATPEEKNALLARATSGKLDTIRGPALEYWKTR